MPTGAEILVESLIKQGVEVIFGYPGGVVLPLYDVLYDAPIRHVLVRHEQAAVHAADAYARVTGKVGVALVTSGPGATNAVTGLANAHMDSVPVVVLTGQVPTTILGCDSFQEADITGISLPVTKHSYLVRQAAEIPRVTAEAFHIAATGRPGPVLVDLPKNALTEKLNTVPRGEINLPGYKPPRGPGHPLQIGRAVAAIREAKRPLVYAGGGVVAGNAGQDLLALAEKLRLPVTATLMGLGGFPGTHQLFLGMLGMHGTRVANMAVMEADLIIAVGARFDDRVTGRVDRFAPRARIVHIDLDPAEIGKNVRVDIPIVGEAGLVLAALREAGTPGETGEWLATLARWKEELPLGYQREEGVIKPQEVIEEIYRLTKGRAVVVTDVGQHQMWTAQYYTFQEPRTLVTSGGLGTMGFGLPAAVGAQVGRPDKTVVLVTGDGSVQMTLQELATVAQEGLPVKIAVINNGYLGMVRQWQQLFYGRHYSSVNLRLNTVGVKRAVGAEDLPTVEGELIVPDFLKLADAYGLRGLRASRPEEVKAVLQKGMNLPGAVLMDFLVAREENVYPMVPAGAALDEILIGD